MKRVFCLLVLVSLVALGNFNRASADGGPVHIGPFHEEGTDVLVDCGGFRVLDAFEGDLSITRFFDREGNRERQLVDFRGTDTFINSETGKSFTESFHNVSIVDYDAGTVAAVGVLFRLTVPGGGAVLLGVGRIVIEPPFTVLFVAGPHQPLEGDFSDLCAAMA